MEPIIANRYRLDERIGSGAMGEVWRARDLTLNRDVAVKIVNLYAPTDPSAAERFRREATATAGLSHPNVVRVFDAGFDDPREAFMVMELLSGPSLGELAGNIGWQEAVEWTAQVAAGLGAAHEVGVIHRDVKPNNVMLDGDGDRRAAKVVDFGIARLAQSGDATLTAPATALGTAAYMSPEQAAGSSLTPASDIYSLGCLLFALLTGKPPFTGDNALSVLQQHVFQTPPLPSERNPAVPESVDALVAQMMQRKPEDRPDAPALAAMTSAVIAQAGGPAEATRWADALPTMPMVARGDDSATRSFAAGADPDPASFPRSQRTPTEPPDQPATWSRTVIEQGGPGGRAERPTGSKAKPRRPVGLIVAIVLLLVVILVVGGVLLLNGRTSGTPENSATPTSSSEESTSKPSKKSSKKTTKPPAAPKPNVPSKKPAPKTTVPEPTAPEPTAPETSAPEPSDPEPGEPTVESTTGSEPDEPPPTLPSP